MIVAAVGVWFTRRYAANRSTSTGTLSADNLVDDHEVADKTPAGLDAPPILATGRTVALESGTELK